MLDASTAISVIFSLLSANAISSLNMGVNQTLAGQCIVSIQLIKLITVFSPLQAYHLDQRVQLQ